MDSKYKPVSQSDSEKGASQNLSPRAKGRGWNRWVVPMLFHGLVFVVYTAILYRYINKVTSIEACVKRFSSWSPALPAVEYESVTFEGQIAAKNKYRGTPTLELDKAWLHISMNAPGVRLFEKDFEAMGKSVSDKSYHRIPKENGGGYLGMTEVFHLLHCLDSIRRATYPEYYPERLKENQFGLRIHDDHCIDIIRQRLMCTGDVCTLFPASF